MGICIQPSASQYLCLGRKYKIIIIKDNWEIRVMIKTKTKHSKNLGGYLKTSHILQIGYLFSMQ